MSGIQLTYDFLQRAAIAGMQANLSLNDVRAKIAQSAIPYGRAVVRGATDNAITLPSTANDLFAGIAIRNLSAENPLVAPGATPGVKIQYEQYEAAASLSTGYIWVITEENVTPGLPVYFRYGANGGNVGLGNFRTTSDAGFTTLLAGATFESTSLAGSVALIRLVK